ncbi:Stk1 family PASTA domain-containing Ser/Thr kinase [Nocardioides solisilvae]|uniref:Stk1 family PASTA domain-containing Ser/Thr kinase n=1 Tax=Nocardioides solisilvae TaxID=1542435 RepID=UPI001EF5F4CA|nr:Stk1 family PASTA domain-containing Ser/Thr kinase [Nocardioides solisilvae]
MQADERASRRAAQAPADPLVGRVLDGRYRLDRRIARGGMAGVYEAHDLRLDRTVAVKVMHPGMGDDEAFAARFVREARAAARLSHPHVVAVHDQGDDDGTLFLAMEHVPGRTLRDVVRDEAPLRPARALELLEPVLSALAAAHRAGLVHRDVKPENVLIGEPRPGEPEQVKVADFGLAKAVSGQTQHTATGVLIGTVSYLAPELVVHGEADPRADVYAVGVVLHELLTGHKPHEGDSPIQVAYKHVHEDVPPPSARVPGIPSYVDALVARATARDRDQRPADAGVLLHQVHRVAQALREGLASDPDLEADLRPTPAAAPLEVEVEADRDGFVDLVEDPPAAVPAPPSAADAEEHHTRQLSLSPAGAGLAVLDAAPTAGPVPTDDPVVPARTTDDAAGASPIPRLPSPRADDRREGARRRRWRGPVLLLLALLLVAGVGGGAWWFGYARWTSTPGVLGLTEAEAVSTLESAGLDAEVGDPAFSETVPPGQVVSTDPEPGGRVLDGGTVTLALSQGPERYEVPDLAGTPLDAAQDAILGTNLAYGERVDRWSENVPEGAVIGTDPAAGTVLKPGAAVDVVVSKGRKPREVTDWTGQSAQRAVQALERQKLVVEQAEEHSDTVPEGTVISQDPATATLYKGDTVRLVVSLGPELVEMPRVIAKGVDAARQELEALGFEVLVEESGQYIGLGFVLTSDPDTGEMVPKGSTVTLYLI